ncbi:zinc finger protein 62-like [Helicoverpa zea]|uniref:zinc finger protein 62-like n=1 Tax=Helicoverpa zea TaxID=7113 RepID=UPI001F575F66|nr:zinc finger protein 62-like [Helicoverpa zea]
MSTSNGVNKQTRRTKSAQDTANRRMSADDYKNIAPEIGFRGFEKVPLVLVPRYDITPYLSTLNLPIKGKKSCMTPSRGKNPPKNRFLKQCTINITRQDLNKLKADSDQNSASSHTSDSDSDADKASMSNIKCKICEKGYSSEKKLLKHQENKHMIVYKPNAKPQKRVSFSDHVIIHEVKEYHKCRKCPKIFENYKFLRTHMKQRHKKRKCYICNYCNKNFVDRTFFKVHIKLHCDVCGLFLPSKVKFNDHRRTVCKVLKLHTCKTCEETYFRFMDLKDHSYNHVDPCFVCDICKDQFKSKCAIAHHIAFLHSNDRPICLYAMRNLGNERLYLCNFCEESSVERDALERHVQLLPDLTNKAMTGYKDYYFCDQCFKKFDTETSMLQHKWTHFLITSDNSQERKGVLKKKVKMTYNVNEPIPLSLQPKLILEKINIGGKILKKTPDFVDVKSFDIRNGEIKKPIVDPKSKKTIISKYQCQTCDKYLCSASNLTRHIETQHSNYENLQCKVCEEIFVWPSLLRSHKCIRLKHPEMPFEDARPEIHFDNLNEVTSTQDPENGFDDLNIIENDDYLNRVDFEIPAPIVELTEYGSFNQSQEKFAPLQSLGYKLVMQEVPIEF